MRTREIDRLIHTSAMLEQEITELSRFSTQNKDKIEELQSVSDKVWDKAKELGSYYSSDQVYEDIGNLVISNAARDFEGLISGSLLPSNDCNLDELRAFAKEQVYSSVNLTEIFNKIEHIYEKEFIPYATENAQEIKKQWEHFNKKYSSWSDRVMYSKYKCPLCGGSLKPARANRTIGCTGCKLETFVVL